MLHFDIDKRNCALEAQQFGYMTATAMFDRFLDADEPGKKAMIRSRDLFGFWQGLLRVVGSFGDCPRCLAVCPVGDDYYAHLVEVQKVIPEKTPEKVAKARAYRDARRQGEPIDGLNDWNIRWVGPEGYKGIVARQFAAFRKAQAERAADAESDT